MVMAGDAAFKQTAVVPEMVAAGVGLTTTVAVPLTELEQLGVVE